MAEDGAPMGAADLPCKRAWGDFGHLCDLLVVGPDYEDDFFLDLREDRRSSRAGVLCGKLRVWAPPEQHKYTTSKGLQQGENGARGVENLLKTCGKRVGKAVVFGARGLRVWKTGEFCTGFGQLLTGFAPSYPQEIG
jgi:hypothetical protein